MLSRKEEIFQYFKKYLLSWTATHFRPEFNIHDLFQVPYVSDLIKSHEEIDDEKLEVIGDALPGLFEDLSKRIKEDCTVAFGEDRRRVLEAWKARNPDSETPAAMDPLVPVTNDVLEMATTLHQWQYRSVSHFEFLTLLRVIHDVSHSASNQYRQTHWVGPKRDTWFMSKGLQLLKLLDSIGMPNNVTISHMDLLCSSSTVYCKSSKDKHTFSTWSEAVRFRYKSNCDSLLMCPHHQATHWISPRHDHINCKLTYERAETT